VKRQRLKFRDHAWDCLAWLSAVPALAWLNRGRRAPPRQITLEETLRPSPVRIILWDDGQAGQCFGAAAVGGGQEIPSFAPIPWAEAGALPINMADPR
jgi:hypothetical protein